MLHTWSKHNIVNPLYFSEKGSVLKYYNRNKIVGTHFALKFRDAQKKLILGKLLPLPTRDAPTQKKQGELRL